MLILLRLSNSKIHFTFPSHFLREAKEKRIVQVSSGFRMLDFSDISNFSDSQDEEEDYVSIHSVFARKAQRPIIHSTVEDTLL